MKEQRVEPFEAEELQAQERHRKCAHRLCKECKRRELYKVLDCIEAQEVCM
jgi:hypothetical protein